MLDVENLQVVYNNTIEAVRNVSLSVPEGRIVALLGANGAGKSTILKCISGTLYPEDGRARDGRVTASGASLIGRLPHEIVRGGIVHVPEGRQLFDVLTVEENLLMGGYTRSRAEVADGLAMVYAMFPRLSERRRQTSGYLSGGEQQMVAIGRALMSRPRLLMLDEPSLGLAPLIIQEIYGAIARLNRETGLTILLVEQNARIALSIAHYGYIMENGRVVLDGPARDLTANDDVREFYLGHAGGGARRSMRDVKHYKRRKRWLS